MSLLNAIVISSVKCLMLFPRQGCSFDFLGISSVARVVSRDNVLAVFISPSA